MDTERPPAVSQPGCWGLCRVCALKRRSQRLSSVVVVSSSLGVTRLAPLESRALRGWWRKGAYGPLALQRLHPAEEFEVDEELGVSAIRRHAQMRVIQPVGSPAQVSVRA